MPEDKKKLMEVLAPIYAAEAAERERLLAIREANEQRKS
jgi:hypothetical protein